MESGFEEHRLCIPPLRFENHTKYLYSVTSQQYITMDFTD
jgi:hypothetical protein